MDAVDEAHLRRALQLARRGEGRTSPNPPVGCVLVDADGRVVGEGHHAAAGRPHAEAAALAAAGPAARGATAYVTLEPCAHHGRTPPCAEALIDAGVRRVVVGVAEADRRAGGGAARLAEAGVAVDCADGPLAAAAERLAEGHLRVARDGRPHVLAKVATSLDGRVAAADRRPGRLTDDVAAERVHRLRAAVDAVVVGVGTALADRPRLTCRLAGWDGPQPLRVVLDPDARSAAAGPLRDARAGGGLVVVDRAAPAARLAGLADHGLDLALLDRPREAQAVLADLAARGVRRVLLEGGPTVLTSWLAAGVVDRLELHLAPLLLGDGGLGLLAGDGIDALARAWRLRLEAVEPLGDGVRLEATPRPDADRRAPHAHGGAAVDRAGGLQAPDRPGPDAATPRAVGTAGR